MVREHDDLETVLRRVGGKMAVGRDHRWRETVVVAFYRKCSSTVQRPTREPVFDESLIPKQEKLRDFFVIHRVRVRGIRDPDIGQVLNSSRVTGQYFVVSGDEVLGETQQPRGIQRLECSRSIVQERVEGLFEKCLVSLFVRAIIVPIAEARIPVGQST